MLALAIAMLHDPEVLMIDELSLGLAPIIVQELIEVVERLKADGVTLIIVEQSLNVAAAIADRAVFLEKGRVRFEGAIADLMERDDLARAVFLGGRSRANARRGVGEQPDRLRRPRPGPGRRRHRRRGRADLPRHADHQLRGRQHGRRRGSHPVVAVVQYHVPFWVGVRRRSGHGTRLRRGRWRSRSFAGCATPHVVVLVATIGIAGLAQAIAIEIPAPTDTSAHYPSAINGTWTVAGVTIRGSDLSILIMRPVTLLALTWFLDRTTLGQTVKACATNPWLARLSAITPKMVSTVVWTLAAGLSTLSVVLIAGATSTAADLTTLGPQTLSEALVAAVIAGFRSIRIAVLAAVAIGVLQSVLTFNFITVPGLTNLLLLIIVFVAVIFAKREEPRARRSSRSALGRDPSRSDCECSGGHAT